MQMQQKEILEMQQKFDTSSFPKTSLTSDVDKLDIDKLKNALIYLGSF